MKKLSIFLATLMIMSCLTAPMAFADPISNPAIDTGSALVVVGTGNSASANNPGIYGKAANDVIYKGTQVENTNNNTTINGKYSQTLTNSTLEFSFALTEESKAFKITLYSANATGAAQVALYMNFLPGKLVYYDHSSRAQTLNYDFGVGQWHNVGIEMPTLGDNSNKKVKIYINGVKKAEGNAYNDDNYGLRYACVYGAVENTTATTGASTTVGTDYYFDNVYTSSEAYEAEKDVPSVITGFTAESGYIFDTENKTITFPFGTSPKVSDLIAAIETTDKAAGTDVVRAYAGTTLLDGEALATSVTDLVVAATNGYDHERAYSYYSGYTVKEGEPDPKVLKGNALTDLTTNSNANSGLSEIALESGVYKKASNDSAYKIAQGYASAESTNMGFIRIWGTPNAAEKSSIEFSFAMADFENASLLCQPVIFTDSSGGNTGMGVYFTSRGLESSAGDLMKEYPFKSGQWYNVGLEFPTGGTSSDVNVYINGEFVYKASFGRAGYGLRYMALNATAKDAVWYLDNIYKAAESYNANRSAAATIEVANGVAKNGKLSMITDDYTNVTTNADSVRMYDVNGDLTDNFANAKTLVFVSENGLDYERTLTYYEKDIKDVIVDYDLDSTTTGEGEEEVTITKLASKVYSNRAATLIVAEYTSTGASRTLADVTTLGATLSNGVYSAEIADITITTGNTYNIYVWDSLTGLTPLGDAVLVG